MPLIFICGTIDPSVPPFYHGIKFWFLTFYHLYIFDFEIKGLKKRTSDFYFWDISTLCNTYFYTNFIKIVVFLKWFIIQK